MDPLPEHGFIESDWDEQSQQVLDCLRRNDPTMKELTAYCSVEAFFFPTAVVASKSMESIDFIASADSSGSLPSRDTYVQYMKRDTSKGAKVISPKRPKTS